MKLVHHPAASILPDIERPEYERLKDDIKRNGLIDEIVLLDGLILDGRHRYRACVELGIVPRVADYDGKLDPHAYVISKNLRRRQLRPSQAACAAVRLKELFSLDAAKRAASGKKISHGPKGAAAELAAKAMGISTTMVTSAVRLKQESPRLFDRAFAGRLTLNQALSKIRRHRSDPAGSRVTVADLRTGISRTITLVGVPMSDVLKCLPKRKED